jgi:uncharacterized protein Yka (UPF0111/DUF47 family)
MFSLKRLLGKDDRFFDLLEAAAEEARASVELFSRYLQSLANGGAPPNVDDFIHTRRKEKRIRHEMTAALSRTFVTPIDREDLEALSFALYRIPKQVEKIVERISICPYPIADGGFRRQAELMLQAAESVAFMVKQLRDGANPTKIGAANDRLQFAEGEADKVMLEVLKNLYRGPADAKELIILQEIYEMIEQAVDRCRNAGNVVVQIALKNS